MMEDKTGGGGNTKRSLSLSPDAGEDSAKHRRTGEATDAESSGVRTPTSPGPKHISIMNIVTPVSTNPQRRESSLVTKCRLAGITGSGGKVDIATVHELLVEVAIRVTTLEEESKEKDEQILSLKRENANLEKKIRDAELSDKEWREHINRELLVLSEGLNAAETKLDPLPAQVSKIEQDLEKLQVDIENLSNAANTVLPTDIGREGRVDTMANGEGGGNDQVRQINLGDMDRELKRVGDAVDKVHIKTHLEGEKRDQYSRRDMVRITGVPFTRGENTTSLACRIGRSLGVDISPGDISVSHRSGRQVGSAPRPILCKFVRRETKHELLKNKRLARHIKTDDAGRPVRIFVDEELTSMRAKICKKLRDEKIEHHTVDGKIHIAQGGDSDGNYKVYDTPADWESLQWSPNTKG